MIAQIIGSFFLLVIIVKLVRRARDGSISFLEFLLWILLLLSILGLILFPTIASRIAKIFGITRGMNFLVYTSIAVLFYLVFRISMVYEKIKLEQVLLVRALALERARPASQVTKTCKEDNTLERSEIISDE